jgi:hypothetical protein
LQRFQARLRQVHISDVNSQSKYDPLSYESILAFQRVAHLIPPAVPGIIESRVPKDEIPEEIENAHKALSLANVLARAGD